MSPSVTVLSPGAPWPPSLPAGGVVIFAVNSLLYLNQSVPPYGVSLNSLTAGTTVFPLRESRRGQGVTGRWGDMEVG